MRIRASLSTRPKGAALVIGLIFLLVTTMIAVLAIGSTVLQERMTGGQRNDSLAHQGAESALRGAELMLWNTYISSGGMQAPTGTFAAQPIDADDEAGAVDAFRESEGWVDVAGQMAYTQINLDGLPDLAGSGRLARAPVYIIESLGQANLPQLETHSTFGSGQGSQGIAEYFRVTSRSTGGDGRVVRTAESVYAMGR